MIGSATTEFVDVEGVGFGRVNLGGFDHFPGAGAPRGCTNEGDCLGLKPWLGDCEFRLWRTGLRWVSASAGGFCGTGLAHFEIGGVHFPRPTDVDVVRSDGGVVDLMSETLHVFGRALTWMKPQVKV